MAEEGSGEGEGAGGADVGGYAGPEPGGSDPVVGRTPLGNGANRRSAADGEAVDGDGGAAEGGLD